MKKVYDNGINDVPKSSKHLYYEIWKEMLRRYKDFLYPNNKLYSEEMCIMLPIQLLKDRVYWTL